LIIFLALYKAGIKVKVSHDNVKTEIKNRFRSQLRSMTLSPIKKTIEITIVNITMKMEMYNLSFKEVFLG